MMEDLGADVVGLNCYRGPEMTMKLLKKVREKVSCHVADFQYLIEQQRKNLVLNIMIMVVIVFLGQCIPSCFRQLVL